MDFFGYGVILKEIPQKETLVEHVEKVVINGIFCAVLESTGYGWENVLSANLREDLEYFHVISTRKRVCLASWKSSGLSLILFFRSVAYSFESK